MTDPPRNYPGRKRGRKPSVLTPLAQDFEKAKRRFEKSVEKRDLLTEKLADSEVLLAADTEALNTAAAAFQEALEVINNGGTSLPEGYEE